MKEFKSKQHTYIRQQAVSVHWFIYFLKLTNSHLLIELLTWAVHGADVWLRCLGPLLSVFWDRGRVLGDRAGLGGTHTSLYKNLLGTEYNLWIPGTVICPTMLTCCGKYTKNSHLSCHPDRCVCVCVLGRYWTPRKITNCLSHQLRQDASADQCPLWC